MDEELTPAQRAELYRRHADEAISCAQRAATEEIRMGYLKIAEDWISLADSIEAHYGEIAAGGGSGITPERKPV